MIQIRETIQKLLESVCPSVYLLSAPPNAPYPRIIYEIEIINQADDLQLVVLDIDGWDNSIISSNLELLMNDVNQILNKKLVVNEYLTIRFYLDRKIVLKDDNPEISRRKYIYQARLYERS